MLRFVVGAGKMSLNIKLCFKSGNTQILERVNYTDELRNQLNKRIDAGIIVDYDVF